MFVSLFFAFFFASKFYIDKYGGTIAALARGIKPRNEIYPPVYLACHPVFVVTNFKRTTKTRLLLESVVKRM